MHVICILMSLGDTEAFCFPVFRYSVRTTQNSEVKLYRFDNNSGFQSVPCISVSRLR